MERGLVNEVPPDLKVCVTPLPSPLLRVSRVWTWSCCCGTRLGAAVSFHPLQLCAGSFTSSSCVARGGEQHRVFFLACAGHEAALGSLRRPPQLTAAPTGLCDLFFLAFKPESPPVTELSCFFSLIRSNLLSSQGRAEAGR